MQFVLELEGDTGWATLSGKRTGSTKEILPSAGGWRAQPCTPCMVIASGGEQQNKYISPFVITSLLGTATQMGEYPIKKIIYQVK